ncbi:structure-specific recognition protein 1 [Vairimorpha apis BRL 01]|uniref:FACT complex subunit POB3 n=1 Tax=Vairimorpha apis BRL 01 TaxID=1037528 RepID=T0L817_9MICR|nr:structure-specific recognition protein 1 [Vairimorpha apis BRL 01]
MEVLTIDNCYLKDSKIVMKLAEEGLAIKLDNNDIITIEKDKIKDIEMFRGKNGINMRIFESEIFFINGINETHIEEIIKICNDCYKLNVYLKELEIHNVVNGDLDVNGKGFIEFRNEKTILEIPLKNIEGVADIRNEISIKFDNVEVRFVTTKEAIKEINEACTSNIEEDIYTFESLTMMYPRGKNNFKLYKDYFRIIGYSYDHKIYYRNVKEIFYLEKSYIFEKETYVLFSLENALRQGLTKYFLIVLSFNNEEIDCEIEDSRLKKRYTGLFSDVFVEIFKTLTNTEVIRSRFTTNDKMRGLKCTFKAYEGQIYPLDGCLIFLPRSLRINIKDIHSVEFSRINVSSLQAKTFDMTISTDINYAFNGLYKEDFGILEKYFTENNIPIRSEVFDEVISSDEEEEDLSDDGFIVSEDDE